MSGAPGPSLPPEGRDILAGEGPGPGEENVLREWVKSIAFAIVAWLILRTFLIQAFRITSESMEGTFFAGDVLFVSRPTFGVPVPFTPWRLPGVRDPRHGDIVVFESVETEGLEVVKRVIGLPGDTLAMREGTLVRNGASLDEPYAVRDPAVPPDAPEKVAKMRSWQEPRVLGPKPAGYLPARDNWGPFVVPPDSLFVMGDNRDHSWDGRYWGFLPRHHLMGSPLIIYYSYDPKSWRPLPLLSATRWSRLLTIPR